MISVSNLFEISPTITNAVVQSHLGTPREQEAVAVNYLNKIREKAPTSYPAQKTYLMNQIKQK